jgi:hypothetical protein
MEKHRTHGAGVHEGKRSGWLTEKEKDSVLGGVLRCLEWIEFARIVGAPTTGALEMATSYLDYYFGRVHAAYDLQAIRGELMAHHLNAFLFDGDFDDI